MKTFKLFPKALITLIILTSLTSFPSWSAKTIEKNSTLGKITTSGSSDKPSIECLISSELAKSKHLLSMKQHAHSLKEGTYCKKNIDEAIYWYKRAYELSDQDSGYELANLYMLDTQTLDKGIKILEKLIDQGMEEATFLLAYYFIFNNEPNKVEKNLEKIQSSKNIKAYELLHLLHSKENFKYFDLDKALLYSTKAAELGSNNSRYLAGKELINQSINIPKGLEFLKQSAISGQKESIEFLSDYYINHAEKFGKNDEIRYWAISGSLVGNKKSFEYLLSINNLKSTDIDFSIEDELEFICEHLEDLGSKSFSLALNELGYLYENGIVCEKNLLKSIFWYKKAYENGSLDAGFYYASLMYSGTDEIDKSEGINILQSLANEGHALSADKIGTIFFNNGNLSKAEYYFQIAANSDFTQAHNKLGHLYKTENTNFFSPTLALKSFKQGSERGDILSALSYVSEIWVPGSDLRIPLNILKKHLSSNEPLVHLYYAALNFEIGDIPEARYWAFKEVLNGDLEATYTLGQSFITTDEKSNEFLIYSTLLNDTAEQGHLESTTSLFIIYSIIEKHEKLQKYIDLALSLTKDDKKERLNLLKDYAEFFIEASESIPLQREINSLLDEYIDLSNFFSENMYKPYYTKHLYLHKKGEHQQSKLYLSQAIQHAEEENVKSKLLNLFNSEESIELNRENPGVDILELNAFSDQFNSTGNLEIIPEIVRKIENIKKIKDSDQLNFLITLEQLASDALFYNELLTSARFAVLYEEKLNSGIITGIVLPKRSLKMKILSLLPQDFNTAQKLLQEYRKYDNQKFNGNNSEIERILIESKLYMAHGYDGKAKNSINSAFEVYLKDLVNQGVCYLDFAIDPSFLFENFTDTELFDMAQRFAKSINKAAEKHTMRLIRNSCETHVKDFGFLVQSVLKDNLSAKLKEEWLDILIPTFFYEKMTSQKNTILNIATLSKIQDKTDQELFNRYIRKLREFEDDFELMVSSKINSSSAQLHLNDFKTLSNVSSEIRSLEDKLYSKIETNPLTPSNWELFSVRRLQESIKTQEGVIIISSIDENIVGFYFDGENSEIIFTDMDKNQYKTLTQKILASVTQDNVERHLDLKPFAFEDAFELYNKIFSKLEGFISSKERLLFVFQGVDAFPVNVLPTERLKSEVNTALDFYAYRNVNWFINNKEVLFVPNINMLLSKRLNLNVPAGELSTIGITPYWDNNKNQSSLLKSSKDLFNFIFQGSDNSQNQIALPTLNESINHVEAMTKLGKKKLLLGENASKDSIIKELENQTHDIVIFSTHALADKNRVTMPSLVISDETGKDFSLLTTSDISKINLAADWVFLIGCNTGITNFDTDYLSLADSFIMAGAKRVVMTDWPIESKATSAFTNKFSTLDSESSITKKISLTQAALRNDRSNVIHAHPMFWGAFRVIGYP